jgi:phage-related tail fiber protein
LFLGASMPVQHSNQSTRADSNDAGAIQPSEWNADHKLVGFLAVLDQVAATPNVVVTLDGAGNALLTPTANFAPSFSPVFTGAPTAPTPGQTVNSNQIVTAAYVKTAIANLIASAPGTLDTLNELATAIGDDPNFSATITASLGNRLRLDAAGGYTTAQQLQGRVNLGLATVAATGSYADLANLPTLGTAAAKNVGASAGNVVQLDGTGKLPAVDGSQLTNVTAQIAVGLVGFFPANAPPAGWLPLDGSLASRATYAALWSYAQASGNLAASDAAWTSNSAFGQFSPGDGATTFRVPDCRGEFIRGWDNGRGVDAGRALGSWQVDLYKNHSHTASSTTTGGSGAAGNIQTGGTTTTPTGNVGVQITVAQSTTGGPETRPRNNAFLMCIKY